MTKDGEENQKSDVAKREEEILKFWQKNDIFKKTLEKDAPEGEFVFYEGPPTANNHPAIHHLEARAFKDLIPRYKTMRGFHVRRKAGWDTHGLPVELEVEKELGLKNKKDIEAYGIEAFNKKCKESVLRYIGEWKEFTDRIGFWVDHNETYFTFDNNYIESVWNIIKHVHERGLLYKDYRVVPWCARCGTPLSSHEVSDGYKDVTDTAVTARFKLSTNNQQPTTDNKKTYILAWTTTPWTLPGNVALAVGADIEYVKATCEGETYIVAKDRVEEVMKGKEYEIVEELKGSDLVGLKYEPLFDISALQSETSHKIYAADFVTTDEGTGIVHTAVMYGQDDFELGTKESLPKHHLVNEDGTFTEEAGELVGMSVFDANEKVIEILEKDNKLFAAEKYEHSYPHCWRCKNPLIYYARDSWFIRMSELRGDLVKENSEIHWEPEHIRDGRFGEWLREVKDWAISRNRYWGTPLPVWVGEKSGELFVAGSIEELKEYTKKSGNTYFLMRHGEAKGNAAGVFDSDGDTENTLTEQGREQVAKSAEQLKEKGITKIYTSPVLRTRQTAEIVAEAIGMPADSIVVDERLGELNFGSFDGTNPNEGFFEWQSASEYKDAIPGGGESYFSAKNRLGSFLYEIEETLTKENVLIISHGVSFESAEVLLAGAGAEKAREILASNIGGGELAEVKELPFVPLPHNEHYELDLHRPYIDEIELEKDGERLVRAEEVLDVWFDSGSMPFAQDHYPFENKEWVEGGGYPANFISEAIDQTRGWFYTLHAIGILMERGKAYKNVISLGHLLDKEGKKMSKSVGNVIDPWDVIAKYGVDALRYWMYTVNEPGNSKNFEERSVDEIVKKNITRLLNVVAFYELYAQHGTNTRMSAPARRSLGVGGNDTNKNILDRWIIARLGELVETTTQNLDAYRVDKAARPIADFIDDLSTWYIRRSRDRFKSDDENDKQAALATTRFVLTEFSKVLAPFMPFIAEDIYQRVARGVSNVECEESVHLEDWPSFAKATEGKPDTEILKNMAEVRRIVSLGLEARTKEGVKVRQPLSALKVQKGSKFQIPNSKFLDLIKDEVNVKEVMFVDELENEVELDTEITPELKREGQARELIRTVQNMRKKAGLTPSDTISLTIQTSEDGREIIEAHKETIQKTTLADKLELAPSVEGEEAQMGDTSFTIKLGKI